MRSPIIYYGGKSGMLDKILPIIPNHDVYTEVFFGGGAVFFAKRKAKNETINDRLDIVVNFYQQLKENFFALQQKIEATCYSYTLHLKAQFMITNHAYFSELERAWAFWFVCNFSHSQKIGGSLKFTNDVSLSPPDVLQNKKREFTELLVKRIESATIENKDALYVLEKRNVANAWHYLDPPYPGSDQGHYKGYTFENLEELLTVCENIKGKFTLSNYNSQLLNRYIKKNGWWKGEYQSNNAGMRKEGKQKVEVLVCNYNPVGAPTMF